MGSEAGIIHLILIILVRKFCQSVKAVIQRVKHANVKVDSSNVGEIGKGLLVLLAVAREDTESDIDYMVKKIAHLRIFDDARGKMNVSALECSAQILVVSQFTLYGDCRKGRRPSFDKAADPQKGEKFYDQFVQRMRDVPLHVETGTFKAMMDVTLVNEGPVTLILESR